MSAERLDSEFMYPIWKVGYILVSCHSAGQGSLRRRNNGGYVEKKREQQNHLNCIGEMTCVGTLDDLNYFRSLPISTLV